MAELPYRFEPAPGLDAYKVTSLLKDYLEMLMEEPESRETIEQIMKLINDYTAQLRDLRMQNRYETTREVFKAIDGFFNAIPEEQKKGIQCKSGCTACCFIEIDVSRDEAAVINRYCRENGMEIDREYLAKQSIAGRKTYSGHSRCVFLKDNLCSIYPVRPVACRKHWVLTDPALCDFSKNTVNPIGAYFDINTEILSSAILNVDETLPLEKALLDEMDMMPNRGS